MSEIYCPDCEIEMNLEEQIIITGNSINMIEHTSKVAVCPRCNLIIEDINDIWEE